MHEELLGKKAKKVKAKRTQTVCWDTVLYLWPEIMHSRYQLQSVTQAISSQACILPQNNEDKRWLMQREMKRGLPLL